jgi:hypothetical protein
MKEILRAGIKRVGAEFEHADACMGRKQHVGAIRAGRIHRDGTGTPSCRSPNRRAALSTSIIGGDRLAAETPMAAIYAAGVSGHPGRVGGVWGTWRKRRDAVCEPTHQGGIRGRADR